MVYGVTPRISVRLSPQDEETCCGCRKSKVKMSRLRDFLHLALVHPLLIINKDMMLTIKIEDRVSLAPPRQQTSRLRTPAGRKV